MASSANAFVAAAKQTTSSDTENHSNLMVKHNQNGHRYDDSNWFINTMFECAHSSARLAFADLLLVVVHYQAASERKHYVEFMDSVDINEPMERQNVSVLNDDRFTVARFVVSMLSFLHLTPKFHGSYWSFYKVLLGLAEVGWHERGLMVKLGAIRSTVAFYLNDQPIVHFNRAMAGRKENGQRQLRRIPHPPRCEDLIKMLSILVRSSSTASFPPLNNIDGDDISGDGAEFEAKHFEYGFAPYFVADGNGSGRGRRIVLPQEDRLCIWKVCDLRK